MRLGQTDRAVRGLLLRLPRTGEPVVDWVGVPALESLLLEQVDDRPVLRVHHEQPAVVRHPLHGLDDLPVVGEENALVGHEELEARHTLVDERVHRREGHVVHAADDLVEGVVDRTLPGGLLVPRGELREHVLAGVLDREVDDRRRAAPRRGPGPRLEAVRGEGPAEGHLHVRVGVDPARDHVLACRVDPAVDPGEEGLAQDGRARFEDGDDRLVLDEDVGQPRPCRVDDGPAGDERVHGSPGGRRAWAERGTDAGSGTRSRSDGSGPDARSRSDRAGPDEAGPA